MNTASILNWINTRNAHMLKLLQNWSAINSHSENIHGLNIMCQAIQKECLRLNGSMEVLNLPPRKIINLQGEPSYQPVGQALRITKRPNSHFRIFLGGHMDTVFQPAHAFQSATQEDPAILRGPGVADMKGGLIVMLTALEAFEQHPLAASIGWEVIINPDEEVGSSSSESLLIAAAKRNHVGLIFEPAFPDGAIVGSRKGSINLAVVAKGQSAHAGRDFEKGKNAVAALATFVAKAHLLSQQDKGLTVNIGSINGGDASNIVPDLAICRINVRVSNWQDYEQLTHDLEELIRQNSVEGTTLTLHQLQARQPKLFSDVSQILFNKLSLCAEAEGFALQNRSSGGVCDGNILAAYGIPVIDTLGVVGGNLHTSNEYMLTDSLVSRSRLTTLLLIELAKEFHGQT